MGYLEGLCPAASAALPPECKCTDPLTRSAGYANPHGQPMGDAVYCVLSSGHPSSGIEFGPNDVLKQ
jgi:hypothetical protein